MNTVCGQNVEFVNVKLVVHKVTTGLYGVNTVGVLVTRKCPVPSAMFLYS